MPAPGDRLAALRARSEDLTGIEFVQVVDKCDQRRLRVYFFTDPRDLGSPFEDLGDPGVTPDPLSLADFRIYNPRGVAPDVEVVPCPGPDAMIWGDDADAGRRFLEICVAEPGDFAEYRLLIDDERIDRFFNDVQFSFKVGCDDRLDCAEPSTECPPEELADFPVDYLARDFVSFRNALLDFAAQRYPNWQVPIEADVGVMLLETMAALGDELSYLQDRHNREAYLETATERRSLRHKARLLDYEIHDGRMASTLLELTVNPGVTSVEDGWPVWARVEGSTPIRFELGSRMRERGHETNFLVDELWNPGNFTVYLFDDGQECLEAGATELFVRNDPTDPGGVRFDAAAVDLWSAGRPLLLRDIPADPSEADRLHVVRVVEVRLEHDDLFDVDVARIRWEAQDAPPFPIPFEQLQLSGNLVPATAGKSCTARFRVGTPHPSGGVLAAVEREGPLFTDVDPSLLSRRNACEELEEESESRPPIYLFSLPGTEESGLAFADPDDDLRRAVPEVRLYEPDEDEPDEDEPDQWSFRRTLIDESGDDNVFTLEDGTWRRIVGRWLGGAELVHRDYATGAGYTVRFGDGEFGRLPAAGALFEVDYRLGSGVKGNVPAGSVNALEIPAKASPLATRLVAASNPFPVTSGVDPESADEIKLLAPEAYKAETFFAVRPEDYGTQAEKLDFVQKAQGSFRWTGSWLSAVTAVDAEDAFELSPERRQLVEALLNCRRQAGRDVIVRDPKFVNLDLVINLCVSRDAFPGQVRVRVLEALFGRGGFRPRAGFFDPDNFTFGTPLRRSALEAAVVSVEGVEAVTSMQIRAHGVTEFKEFEALAFEVGDDELVRVENSALRPERGSLTLELEGGA